MISPLKLYKTLQVVIWSKSNIGIDPRLIDSYGKIIRLRAVNMGATKRVLLIGRVQLKHVILFSSLLVNIYMVQVRVTRWAKCNCSLRNWKTRQRWQRVVSSPSAYRMEDHSGFYTTLRLGAALVSCAIANVFVFWGGGCCKYVYIMLTFVYLFVIWLFKIDTNSRFKDRKQYEDTLGEVCVLFPTSPIPTSLLHS